MRTRSEHLVWSKERALACVDRGDLTGALSSMISDLEKQPETAGHAGLQLGLALMMAGHLDTPTRMRDHIEGYN